MSIFTTSCCAIQRGAGMLGDFTPLTRPTEPGTYRFINGEFRKVSETRPAVASRPPAAPAPKKVSQAELAAARAAFTQALREDLAASATQQQLAAPPRTPKGIAGRLRFAGGVKVFNRRREAMPSGRATC